ncbi:MAG: SsrA-binding protein SmpB [Patescibacteria group bacterium]|jgi:SsrA-binding protein
MPQLANNRKGYFTYTILDKIEAGIVLTGTEVKSAKMKMISLEGSYVTFRDDELWLIHSHISAYSRASHDSAHNPDRDRKLLVKRAQVNTLIGKMASEGLTMIPLSMYTKGSLIKVELGLARGKKKHDKRESIKKREVNRRIHQLMGKG